MSAGAIFAIEGLLALYGDARNSFYVIISGSDEGPISAESGAEAMQWEISIMAARHRIISTANGFQSRARGDKMRLLKLCGGASPAIRRDGREARRVLTPTVRQSASKGCGLRWLATPLC
jgi:hypothetical protein